MLYEPLAVERRCRCSLCFASSFPRCPNPGGSGHVKGARAHRAQRGRPLTWPRPDYIALLEEEAKQQRQRRRPRARAQRNGPRRGVGRATGAAGSGSTHPPMEDRLTYSGAQRPGHPPVRGAWGAIRSRRTGRAQRRWCRPLLVVCEGVKGGAPGLRRDRATLRLAPEDVVLSTPATAGPAGLCIIRKSITTAVAGDYGRPVQARGGRSWGVRLVALHARGDASGDPGNAGGYWGCSERRCDTTMETMVWRAWSGVAW
jgi:hypothetical protein